MSLVLSSLRLEVAGSMPGVGAGQYSSVSTVFLFTSHLEHVQYNISVDVSCNDQHTVALVFERDFPTPQLFHYLRSILASLYAV